MTIKTSPDARFPLSDDARHLRAFGLTAANLEPRRSRSPLALVRALLRRI